VGASNGCQVGSWFELLLQIVLVTKMNRMIELVLRVCSWVGHKRFVVFELVLVGNVERGLEQAGIVEQVLVGIVERGLEQAGIVEQVLVGIVERELVQADNVERELVQADNVERELVQADNVERELVQADRFLGQADKLPELEQSGFAQHKIGLEKMIVPVVQLVGKKAEQALTAGTSG
jgi:hypothetical protein